MEQSIHGGQRVRIDAHRQVIEPWRQAFRGGSVQDRKLREVTVSLPPDIAEVKPSIPSAIAAEMDEALREIAALDETHGAHLASLSTMLLRAESVASSKIENEYASVDDYARALHGIKSNSSANSMVASTRALDALISSVHAGEPIELASIYRAHSILMSDDVSDGRYAGRPRDMQNWIEGSDYSPRGASYVPLPPRMVRAYLDDLVSFANRTDIGILVQVAIAHAQFESIHPFTDGNGRIGRALINTILRRRGTTRRTVVPLASAIVARRQDYFDALGSYRDGDVTPIISAFAVGSVIAAQEARASATRLAAMPEEWRDLAGAPRKGSAAAGILDNLLNEPVFSAEDAETRIGGSTSSIYAAISRLHSAGVIRPLTHRTRNQIWVAASLADELDDLGVRIAARARGATL